MIEICPPSQNDVWRGAAAEVGAAGDPKNHLKWWLLYQCGIQPASLTLPPQPCEKQKDGIWFRGQIRFVHVRAGPSACSMRAASSSGDREMATSFTRSTRVGEPLSAQWDDRRVTLAMDGALQMKKINKRLSLFLRPWAAYLQGSGSKVLLIIARL